MLKVNSVMRLPGKFSVVLRNFQPMRGMRLRAITGFPLLSTGRGIKGEGWERSELPALERVALKQASLLFCPPGLLRQPPLTLTLFPLRGEGEAACAPQHRKRRGTFSSSNSASGSIV